MFLPTHHFHFTIPCASRRRKRRLLQRLSKKRNIFPPQCHSPEKIGFPSQNFREYRCFGITLAVTIAPADTSASPPYALLPTSSTSSCSSSSPHTYSHTYSSIPMHRADHSSLRTCSTLRRLSSWITRGWRRSSRCLCTPTEILTPISTRRGNSLASGLTYEDMIYEVVEYVESLKFKYPYWNRTLGADHFFVTCHDIGVKATKGVPNLVKNSSRVVCSSSYDDDYIPHKDVTFPQVQLPFFHPARGGNDIKNRNTLAFWAGRSDSKLKDELAAMWDNDTELDIQNNRIDLRATGPIVYMEKLYKSKFCLCPHGPVGSSRIADSIHYGCVPVIMSNYYDLPFNDILDWRKFSVILKESDVHKLKYILRNISEKNFMTLNRNLVKVQKHFEWNTPPVRLDAFHMAMYELWVRRHLIRY